MNLVALHGGEAVTMSSLELVDFINGERRADANAAGHVFPSKGFAELAHADFLKKVPDVLGGGHGFFSDTYVHPQNGQTYPCYRFPKREACLMAMSYSYELQAKVFDRMTELEQAGRTQLPDFTNPVAAARAWADAVEKTQIQAIELAAQQAQLESQRPAVEFVDRFVEAKSAKGLREVAKILGVRERKFIADLADRKIIFKQGRDWLPFAEHQHAGRFEVKTGEANGHTYAQTRFTPEGIAWIAKRYATQQQAVI